MTNNSNIDSVERNITVRATKLMKEAFNNEYDKEVFFNKHFCNPNRVTNPVDIVTDDGEDAGVGCFFGMKLLNNESDDLSREYVVTQSCDVCVHPQFQGKGFFGVIFGGRDKSDNEDLFVWGLPNKRSFPVSLKNGFYKCSEITRYRKYTNKCFSFIKKVVRKITGKKAKIIGVKNAHNVKELETYFTMEEYSEINSAGIRFERSEELFKWLFTYKKSEYLMKEYDENKKLISYAIFRHEYCPLGTVIAIDDWYSRNNNPDYFKTILKSLGRYCDMIEIYTVNEKADGEFMRKSGLSNIKLHDKNFKDRPLVIRPGGKDYPWFEKVSVRNVDDDYFFYE